MEVDKGMLFSRSEALLGEAAMKRLAEARVLVVGIGGVGSWCAEALVRTGLGQITLVDDDVVAESNVNRQSPATVATVGRPKVEAMAERLAAINPGCEIVGLKNRYPLSCLNDLSSEHRNIGTSDHVRNFSLSDYDAVIDAIDSVDCKAELILGATEAEIPIVSSMGAALRLDPTKVKVTRFEKVEGDGLAKALRRRFKKLGRFPAAKFICAWSTEHAVERSDNPNDRAISKGSIMPVTATFGMCLASEAIKILTEGETK